MSNIGELRHVVVTPSRNESAFLPELAESMTKQSIVPSSGLLFCITLKMKVGVSWMVILRDLIGYP